MTTNIPMYNSNVLHLIQNPVYRLFPLSDYPGNYNFSTIMFAMECISEDNCKEGSHFIIDFRILRLRFFRKE